MKRIIACLLAVCCVLSLVGCSKKQENKVVIYSSDVDFSNEYILSRLKEQFPEYDVTLQYLASGNNAAKIKSEGKNTQADIVLALESSYMEGIKDNLAALPDDYYLNYLPDMIPQDKKYVIWERFSGCIAINPSLLEQKGIQPPENYQDLLKPEYKGFISMPNPKSSSTGYIFVKSLINAWGKDSAMAYFDELSKNISQFTSSGSGPVSALVQKEAAVGLGMTYQAVNQINDGVDLKIIYFSEGAPYTTDGIAIIDGKETKKAVKDVFDFLRQTVIFEHKEKFSPENIFINQANSIDNYPSDIPYSDMTGVLDLAEKDRLLAEWKY